MGAYFNPLTEIPLYGMVVSDWNDQLIAVILVLMHLPNLYVIWKITEQVTAQAPGTRLFACWAATLLAFVAPIQLTTLSNTFADPTAGLFTLLGLYVLLRHTETPAPPSSTLTDIST